MDKTNEQRVFDILSYYRVSSEVIGRDRDSEDEGKQQAGYSIHWFYESFFPGDGSFDNFQRQNVLKSLTPQLRAFLIGEGEERERLFGLQQGAPVEIKDSWLLENEAGHNLNASQRSAISHVLGDPISLIQGPPGTGKTETILNMVSCILAQPGNPTVAVIASNGKAISNIVDKVNEHRNCSPDRMPNWHRLCRSFAQLGNKKTLEAWCKEHPEEAERFVFIDKGKHNASSVKAEDFLSEYPFITSTVHSLAKCFRNGISYRYDYIIIDEASQCDIMLGLIPMNLAKHLVLVGDTKQLSPVYKEELQPVIDRAAKVERIATPQDSILALSATAATGTKEGNSVLAAMECIAGDNHKVLLNEHYRCHPGIIEYCNQKFYDGRLVIKTKGDKRRPPIRVRWFAGNYAEAGGPLLGKKKTKQSQNTKISRRNMRQIEVFMTEEWPLLERRLKEENPPSFCVLSPFRAQIEELKKALTAVWDCSEFELAIREETEIAQFESDPTNDFTLCAKPKKGATSNDKKSAKTEVDKHGTTIHKSQGSEFDIVYLLPVDDLNWEWPWSQGDRLINVAVSRAKKELVVILSSGIMSEKVQKTLSKAKLLRENCLVSSDIKKKEGKADSNHSNSNVTSDETDSERSDNFLYVEQLIDYVADCGASYYPQGTEDWGFFRSGIVSIFDEVPRKRQEANGTGNQSRTNNTTPSTETVLSDALREMNLSERGLIAKREVRLKDLQLSTKWENILSNQNSSETIGESAEMPISKADKLAFVERNVGNGNNGSHFDFVVVDKATNKLVLAIEIDGEVHRTISYFDKNRKDATDAEIASQRIKNYLARRRNDQTKDSIVVDMGGTVLYGNKRSACENISADASFALLRLPTDGTTAWETKKLKRGIPPEARDIYPTSIRDSFVTIEELLDNQLDRGFDRAPHVPTNAGEELADDQKKTIAESISLSTLLKQIRDEDPDFSPKLKQTKDANTALAAAGLIKHDGQDWIVTEAGEKVGIEQAQFINEDGSITRYCRYPAHCHNVVKKALSENA